jgi:energy-coupling factor transporter ATP-binding protein EcfA2
MEIVRNSLGQMEQTMEQSTAAAHPRTEPLLQIVDLTFTYSGMTTPTLQGVNLTLHPGEMVWIAGATGSGKSTLLNCITGIAPTHTGGRLTGEIRLQGQDARAWPLRERSRHLCTLLQNVETQIFTDRVWDEVIFGLENWAIAPNQIAPLATQALQEFRLTDKADWAIARLSAGQKQRLLLACMLAIGQPILVLDEPSAYLDTHGVELLLHLLKARRRRGDGILVIEHRLELMAQVCDRAYGVQAGRLIPWDPATVGEAMAVSFGGERDADDRSGRLRSDSSALATGDRPSTAPNPAPIVLRTEQVAWGGYLPYPDLQVTAGEAVLLKGENGCGKTTLLRLISGLLKPDQGRIEILGRDIRRRRGVEIAQTVGFVLQNPNHQLFAESVRAEVRQPGTDSGGAEQLLAQLDLLALGDRHPHALSQGQKRRLALAAVLVRQPRICLLDEIMVGQDGRSLLLMLQVLRAFTQAGGTLIFTSHDPRVVEPLGARIVDIPTQD